MSPQPAPDPTAGVLTARTAPACAGCKHTRDIHAPRADPFYYCCHAERSVHTFFLIIFLLIFNLQAEESHDFISRRGKWTKAQIANEKRAWKEKEKQRLAQLAEERAARKAGKAS